MGATPFDATTAITVPPTIRRCGQRRDRTYTLPVPNLIVDRCLLR